MDNQAKWRRSLSLVAAARERNLAFQPERMTADQKEQLLRAYHPDYREDRFASLSLGPNAGEPVPEELAALLQANSRVSSTMAVSRPDYDVDVLVIGGGGAGAAAALEAEAAGASVLLTTKLRLGDSNTMMAEGGIQAADKPNDSPARHYLDSFGGGHFSARPELLAELVKNGPSAIRWLTELGVSFDRQPDGGMLTTHGGGTSRKRMHAAGDHTGAEMMRTLRDEVQCRRIPVLEFTAAIELLIDQNGGVAGAVLQKLESGEQWIVRAKTVVLATGGIGRVHVQGFPTSNHYGATGDGLVLAYRAGARLLHAESLQYHPTGAAFPQQLRGLLVTEKARALGAKLIGADGSVFVHPLETRDVAAAAIIRECTERGNGVTMGKVTGVWLDTPMIEAIHGEGTIQKRLPGMLRMFGRCGIDIRTEPILVYPTLHYQNGGVEIRPTGETGVTNLYAAGEVTGGIHGHNRLMGNALLDIVVFGRIAGRQAAERAKTLPTAKPGLDHVAALTEERTAAGLTDKTVSPLLLPDYRRKK